MKTGKFITIEGCDGCGKSTQTERLKEYFDRHGFAYVSTREPGGGKISEAIRELILDGKNAEMTDECEALLYAAARVQHLSDTVAPALEAGKIVLCDRYVDSSFAYQAEGRGLGDKFVASINAYAIERFTPDATIFIDLPPREAFLRKHGADKEDRIEQAGEAFHKKVYEGYRALLQKYPEQLVPVDCSGNKFQTHEKIVALLKRAGVIG